MGFAGLAEHVSARILGTDVVERPWMHLRVTDVFPAQVYRDMLANFPAIEDMAPLSEMSPNRRMLWLHRNSKPQPAPRFWRDFGSALFAPLKKTLEKRFAVRGSSLGAELVYDVPGYQLGPHTDTPERAITGLFYLPADDALAAQGTVLMAGREHDNEGLAHDFGPGFKDVVTVPFVPNTALFFVRSHLSFHGVHCTTAPRSSLAFDVLR